MQVEILSIETAEWGWTGILPSFGLLHDEFLAPKLKVWKIDKQGGFAWFDEEKGIQIPIQPFAGEMGVARGVKGSFSTIPPYPTGVSPNSYLRLNFGLMMVRETSIQNI